jgi:hypothetical protein
LPSITGIDVAEPEHPRAVGADRNAARDHRVPRRELGLGRDRRAHARDARGVHVAHLLHGTHRPAGVDPKLAAQMAKQSPVLVPQDLHIAERADQLGDPIGLGGVPDLDGYLPHRVLAAERDRDHVADQAAALGDGLRHTRELAGVVGDLEPIGAVEHAPPSKRSSLTAVFITLLVGSTP